MLRKIITALVGIVIVVVIFLILFFDLEFPKFKPEPILEVSSKSYFDIQDRPIEYTLEIHSTLHYSRWSFPWERRALEDSLVSANQRIMDTYFQRAYMEECSDEYMVTDFSPQEYFLWNGKNIDSVLYTFEISKNITFPNKKPPL